ncbi:MAG: type II secretion system protein [Burkholderiales bacterium]|nr:type II secretion system protein [Burkholderiales bacterium]
MYTSRRARSGTCVQQRGITMIELVMFIVVVGLAVAGILLVYANTIRYSADPVIRKQMLSIAEAMLEETVLMPFTFCDPDDANAAAAGAALVGAADCANAVEAIGPEPGEARYAPARPFDNANDYAGFDTTSAVPAGIADISGTVISSLSHYSARVSARAQALGPDGSVIAESDGNGAPQVLLVTVTVTAPDGDSVSLSGYRTRYAPNAVP